MGDSRRQNSKINRIAQHGDAVCRKFNVFVDCVDRRVRVNKTDQIYVRLLVERIRSLCQRRGLSINKLAEMSDIGQSTIDNLMNGHTLNPGIRTLHKIALAFSMTLAEFLDFKELNEFSFDDDK